MENLIRTLRPAPFMMSIDLSRMLRSAGFKLRRVKDTNYEFRYQVRVWSVVNSDGDFLFHIFEDDFQKGVEC
jgi:hypothetical protein